MFTKAIALATAILVESNVNAVVAGNTVAQISNISEEKFLNFAQTESGGLNGAPYPYNWGYGDYNWWVQESDEAVFVFLDLSEEQINFPCQ